MKFALVSAAVALFALVASADRERLQFALWYGIKNTANDLDIHTIATKAQP